MGKLIDLTGKSFGRLTIISEYKKGRVRVAICKCSCGAYKAITKSSVSTGEIRSCGCLVSETAKQKHTKHGLSNSKEYACWVDIRRKCTDHKRDSYKNYGAKGITVCDRWKNSFDLFLSDVGYKPSKSHSIERRNNKGNYEPGNCYWATSKVQANNRSSNWIIQFNGQNKTLSEWCDLLGLCYIKTWRRLKISKWTLDRAFSNN